MRGDGCGCGDEARVGREVKGGKTNVACATPTLKKKKKKVHAHVKTKRNRCRPTDAHTRIITVVEKEYFPFDRVSGELADQVA